MSFDLEKVEEAAHTEPHEQAITPVAKHREGRRSTSWKVWLTFAVVFAVQIVAIFFADGMGESEFVQERMAMLQGVLTINVMIGVALLGLAVHHFIGNKELIAELDRNQSQGFARIEGIVEKGEANLQRLDSDIGAKVVNLEAAGNLLQDSLGRLKQLELRLNSSLEAYAGGDKYLSILKNRLNSLPRGEGVLIGQSIRVVSSYKFLHKDSGPISDNRTEALQLVSKFAYDCRVQIKLLFSVSDAAHLEEVQDRIAEEIKIRVRGIKEAHDSAVDPHQATCLLVGFVDTSSQDMMLIPEGHTFLHFRTTGRSGARNGYYLESKEAYQSHRKRFQHMVFSSSKEATERMGLNTAAWIAALQDELGDCRDYLQAF